MRKGQAAMEFLMTYGWAILVVLAAIAALAYFGVLSPDRFFPDKCIIQGGGFSCVESKVTDTGTTDTVEIVIRNSGGSNMQAVNVTLTGDTTGCLLPEAQDADTSDVGLYTVGTLRNGESTAPLVFNCEGDVSSASKFRGTIVIDYLPDEASLWQRADGSITKAVTQG